jgi:hypothetical protein
MTYEATIVRFTEGVVDHGNIGKKRIRLHPRERQLGRDSQIIFEFQSRTILARFDAIGPDDWANNLASLWIEAVVSPSPVA